MDKTASTIAGVSCSARAALSLVARDVLATDRRSSRSTSFSILKVSRNYEPYISWGLLFGLTACRTFNVSVLATW